MLQCIADVANNELTFTVKMKKSDKEAYSGGKKPPPVTDEEVAEGENTSLQVEAAAAAASLEKNEQVEVDNRTKANGLSNGVNNGPPLKTPEDDIEEGGGGEHSKVMKQAPLDTKNVDDMTGKGTIAVIPGRNNVQDNDDNSSSDESVIQPGFMFIPGPNYTGTGIHTGYHSDHEDNNDTTDNNLSEMGITATTEAVPESHIVPSAYLVQDVEVAQAEEVKPFLKQKEGKFTILIVGLLLLSVAILLAVFLSGQGGRSGVSEVKNDVLLPSEAPTTSPTFDPRPTLDIVRERGVVNCGIEDLREGDINLNEFNIDQCRSVAATIFGDPTKINLVIVGREDQYEKLYDRQVDVLFTGNTFTLEKLIREVSRWAPM